MLSRRPRRPDAPSASGIASHLGVMLVVAVVIGVLTAGLVIPFAAVAGLGARNVAAGMDDLPEDLDAEPLAQRTRVLAADGSLLATWFDQNRVNVRLDKVSLTMRKAIIAIEDYRFYQHGALDLKGTLRAFITNQAQSGVVQGGSSITQQMVKMTLLNQADTEAERLAATAESYERKFRELRYAIAFEEKYSKDWILERYLNIAYFGDGAYGIQAAARHYFSKNASALNLRESALLAGIVQNPSRFDPTNDPEAARNRRDVVLNRMAELNVISETEARKAKARNLGLRISPTRNGCVSTIAPFFCDYLREYLLKDKTFGETVEDRSRVLDTGGLTIYTTLDPRFQKAADESIQGRTDPTDQAIGGLAMVVPGTGEVRALAQSRPMGRDRSKGETFLNYVVPKKYGDSNGFQAGSTFKVFVLAAAIKQGIPLSTQISAPPNRVIPVSDYRDCEGFIRGTDVFDVDNSTNSGTFDLYKGTQLSVNTFFAELERRTGLCEPSRLAREMGIPNLDGQIYPTFTLGVTDTDPLSLAGAYATFAARGVHCEPRPVTQVVTASGKVIKTYPDKCEQVLPSDVADAVNDILRGVQEPGGFGYNNGINTVQPSAGKTGTIQENRAVWFAGYTPNLSTVAMLAGANQLGQPITLNGQTVGGGFIAQAFGSTYAGPIWGDAMKVIEQWLPDTDFTPPNPQTIAGQIITVPSVYGSDPADAAKLLRRAGLLPDIGPMVDSAYPRGTVAYTSPGAGSQIGTGSPITIYVSDGTPPPAPKPPPRDRDGGGGGGDGGGNDGPGNGNGNGNGNRDG